MLVVVQGGAMGVRELKEEALDLYAQRKFTECARTYEKLLELDPSDPHLYVRHAEAWRRAGDRTRAITSYRTAAELLLQLGCEARARAALKVALDLDPRDTEVARALERLSRANPPRREEVHSSRWTPTRPSPAEVRRLSGNTLAVRSAPGTRWLVVSSRTPLTAYEVDDIERVISREFTLEVTVAPEG